MRTLSVVLICVVVLGVGLVPGARAADPSEFEIVAEYITKSLVDFPVDIEPDALYKILNDGDKSNDPLVLSVRTPEDYAAGHIPGAYNIYWRELPRPENLKKLPYDRQIVTYSETGDAGMVAATFLRLMGFDAVNLDYGLMGWTADETVVGATRFKAAAGYPTDTAIPREAERCGTPDLETGMKTARDIIQARALAEFTEWVPTITAEALHGTMTDALVGNDAMLIEVRLPEDYAKGHIKGAYNVLWSDIAKPENTKWYALCGQPIVTYCYTGDWGQTAATALRLMGYPAVGLRYGVMSWTADEKVLGLPPFAGPLGYPLETTPHALLSH